VIVALLAFLSVVRLWNARPELPKLTLAVGIGIILQAVIGGITVWLHLHPAIVGLHFLISAALVAVAAAYVVRVYAAPGPRRLAVPGRYAALVHVTSVFVLITVVIGILLTGSGPHAGDDAAARNGSTRSSGSTCTAGRPTSCSRSRSSCSRGPSGCRALRLPLWSGLLLAVEGLQIVVGLWQARTGLPIALVNIHMVLAVSLVAAMTSLVLHLKAPLAC
jgi:cytochrome c oxidase assembly protein subunit 15